MVKRIVFVVATMVMGFEALLVVAGYQRTTMDFLIAGVADWTFGGILLADAVGSRKSMITASTPGLKPLLVVVGVLALVMGLLQFLPPLVRLHIV